MPAFWTARSTNHSRWPRLPPKPMTPQPPLTPRLALPTRLAGDGWAVVAAPTLAELCGRAAPAPWAAWSPLWQDLPPDAHLRDGGRYRRRRHGSYIVDGAGLTRVPQRAHWQPVEYNALHGGFERWFEPLPEAFGADPDWTALLAGIGGVASALRGVRPWYVEAHAFRIDTAGGIGRPTPEGAHRDGVDLVAVLLVARHNVRGGETRVFDAAGPQGVRFTLAEPWSALLLDDARVIHETTPIQPLDAQQPAWRDTLVLTYRSGGFQEPAAPAREPR
ncbi:MAG: 2OG-Fe dioxygenase family protein [Burkholderiales bacterium]|nr:2OG-Fe dioxygenase family protein [Burkholderiales bacterium]MDE1928237.1 2OG-Fe dioxygenase family protein [Burkholderiales bacterium]MDE2160906.1 2OG-Fe dioxygenase family protein [Burkholderiales bacterium]MDE2504565.1 2OG-Fe dioxygenase family protein [Burkholderiales bacterium]